MSFCLHNRENNSKKNIKAADYNNFKIELCTLKDQVVLYSVPKVEFSFKFFLKVM